MTAESLGDTAAERMMRRRIYARTGSLGRPMEWRAWATQILVWREGAPQYLELRETTVAQSAARGMAEVRAIRADAMRGETWER